MIIDDELNRLLVNPLPQGVRLHAGSYVMVWAFDSQVTLRMGGLSLFGPYLYAAC